VARRVVIPDLRGWEGNGVQEGIVDGVARHGHVWLHEREPVIAVGKDPRPIHGLS
jgi:hypothetical protein